LIDYFQYGIDFRNVVVLLKKKERKMSGSGGSGYGGGFESANGTCDSLVIDTQISSPKDDVVNLIVNGDVLNVDIQQIGGKAVVVVLHNGQLAGGLASPNVQRLRECIEQGTQYDAKVTSKNDGQVRVRVSARRL
jgi:hypothetical protein